MFVMGQSRKVVIITGASTGLFRYQRQGVNQYNTRVSPGFESRTDKAKMDSWRFGVELVTHRCREVPNER
jgi:hypothetical protein